ncbi:PREDICTED: putative uncharacterized protein C11orf80 homolog [Chrysochloris asiatica]|uniref:Type 2 DNA topoisomerase 6 subunit B-like n=1 Tax=Chrysochloris asiatica TaxID=185453 RepID=A0A9B0TGI1_CHRAS|nr:PREDICTED: putative uncharacterized protein C11orf80 homolog [Chrysochloris asiatica]
MPPMTIGDLRRKDPTPTPPDTKKTGRTISQPSPPTHTHRDEDKGDRGAATEASIPPGSRAKPPARFTDTGTWPDAGSACLPTSLRTGTATKRPTSRQPDSIDLNLLRPRRRQSSCCRTKRTKRPGAGTYLGAEGTGRQLPREARDHLEPAAPRGLGRGRVTPSPLGAMATAAPLSCPSRSPASGSLTFPGASATESQRIQSAPAFICETLKAWSCGDAERAGAMNDMWAGRTRTGRKGRRWRPGSPVRLAALDELELSLLLPASDGGDGYGQIQPMLPGLSAKLMWTSEEASCPLDMSGRSPFQIIVEVDEKPGTLMTDCLAIKNFLRKVIIVHPKIGFHFNVKVNGTLSTETFRVENEPIFNLPNGMALIVNDQLYVSRPEFGPTGFLGSRIHPVPGEPVTLSIPDDVADLSLLGELILTPVAALCPCPKAFSKQTKRISSLSIFLYGPSGLPLILPSQQQPATVFTDISCFIDWKKYHLYVASNLDFNLDRDTVLPDMSYQVESLERHLSQNTDPQGQTLLLFLFVDFHSGFPVQHMELWGAHTFLTAHLSAILRESHVVRDSVQMAVDQALEQHHQAAKAHQKLQAAHAVAVESILNVVIGSTSNSFRKMCLQALQAADTRELGTKLQRAFNELTQHRFLHPCSCEVKQLPPEESAVAQSREDTLGSRSPECLADPAPERRGMQKPKLVCNLSLNLRALELPDEKDNGGQGEIKRRRRCVEETQAAQGSSGRKAGAEQRREPPLDSANPGSGQEDALWLQEVANLSEWLSAGP